MKLSSPVNKLKRQAKLLSRDTGIKLHQALNRIAAQEGFSDWSHLASAHAKTTPAKTILQHLNAGDMVLIGARPGHGKTLLGLEICAMAEKIDRAGYVFTLSDTQADVSDRFKTLGFDPSSFTRPIVVDTSDTICAEHITARLSGAALDALIVVDYLQLLDQKRSHPPLDVQIQMLKTFAVQHGAVVVILSQINRAYDQSTKTFPGKEDIRLPNPVDLSLFDRLCFLQDGEVQMHNKA